MALVGASIAALLGLLLTAILQGFVRGPFLAATSAVAAIPAPASLSVPAMSSVTSNILTLFSLELGVPVTVLFAAGNSVAQSSATVGIPVTTLLVIPAATLVFGGVIAGSTDLQRFPAYGMARGALIGPFYALIVGLTTLVSTLAFSGHRQGVAVSLVLGSSLWQACAYGLIWGLVFGALGGWIQLSGREVLSAVLPTIQSAWGKPRGVARLVGAVAGSMVAIASGVLIFLVLAWAAIGFMLTSAAAKVTPLTVPGPFGVLGPFSAGTLPVTIVLATVFAPTIAMWAFALASGGSVDAYQFGTAALGGSRTHEIGLLAAHLPPTQQAWYAIMVVPAIAYLVGGRVAARISQADRVEFGVMAGASIAVPMGPLLAAAAFLSSGRLSMTMGGQSLNLGIGPTAAQTVLIGTLAAAIFGGLGGASEIALNWLGELPRVLPLPLFVLTLLSSRMLDVLTGRPPGRRSAARKWLYEGVLAVSSLGILTEVLERVAGGTVRSMGISTLASLYAWGALLIIAVPLLFLVGALVSAFSAPGQGTPRFMETKDRGE